MAFDVLLLSVNTFEFLVEDCVTLPFLLPEAEVTPESYLPVPEAPTMLLPDVLREPLLAIAEVDLLPSFRITLVLASLL